MFFYLSIEFSAMCTRMKLSVCTESKKMTSEHLVVLRSIGGLCKYELGARKIGIVCLLKSRSVARKNSKHHTNTCIPEDGNLHPVKEDAEGCTTNTLKRNKNLRFLFSI
jgi:hypothetical protein